MMIPWAAPLFSGMRCRAQRHVAAVAAAEHHTSVNVGGSPCLFWGVFRRVDPLARPAPGVTELQSGVGAVGAFDHICFGSFDVSSISVLVDSGG